MIYSAPPLDDQETRVLGELKDLKESLRYSLGESRRWKGSLRRLSFARNIQGSNSIEGFDAALDDAAAVAVGEEPLDADEETRLALLGYRNAMTYVLQLSEEPQSDFSYSPQLLKGLHFMMTHYALVNRPGRWRAGPIYVRDEETGEIVYEGADIDDVARLVTETTDYLNQSTEDPIVRAAMAHLNLVMIHPFRDGNGRMARCLQSLVLAREGTLAPEFMSIEEYLGRNTQDYYNVLGQVSSGTWSPGFDARPWIRFALTAHLRQARTLKRRLKDSERLWTELTALVGSSVDDRTLMALYDAAYGLRIRRSTYIKILAEMGEDISEQTASRDLRALCDREFLVALGESRGRYYVAGPAVKRVAQAIRHSRLARDNSDPFAEVISEQPIGQEPLF